MEGGSSCSVRLCRISTVSSSPVTGLPVCGLHLQADLSDIQTSETLVAQSIAHFRKYQRPLRQMERRLSCDLMQLERSFRELRDTLDKCQKELVAIVKSQHDKLCESLNIISELDNYETELRLANEQNDAKQRFILNNGMEKFLKTQQLDSKLVAMDKGDQFVRMVAYPDVNSRVRDLQACAEIQLTGARKVIESLDVSVSDTAQPALRLEKCSEKVRLNGKPVCMTLCSKTDGYAIDESNTIVKLDATGSHTRALPQPSIFIAIEFTGSSPSDGNGRFESKNSEEPPTEPSSGKIQLDELGSDDTTNPKCVGTKPKYRIDLVSSDSQVSVQIPCCWDGSNKIRDLHCDSSHQKLFVAQKSAISVTDISGTFRMEIAVTALQNDAQKVYCIAGNSEHLFALAKLSGGQKMIFGLSIETGETQIRIPFPGKCEFQFDFQTRIAVRSHMLLVSDYETLLTICTVTGHLAQVESLSKQNLFLPIDIEDENDRLEPGVNADIDVMLLFEHKPVPRISALMTYSIPPSSKTLVLEHSFDQCVLLMLEDGELSLSRLKICGR